MCNSIPILSLFFLYHPYISHFLKGGGHAKIMFFKNSYFETIGYQDLTDFLLKFFAVVFAAKSAVKNRFPPPPTFQCTGCGLSGAGTDVASHQDPVSRSPTARMARQTPLRLAGAAQNGVAGG